MQDQDGQKKKKQKNKKTKTIKFLIVEPPRSHLSWVMKFINRNTLFLLNHSFVFFSIRQNLATTIRLTKHVFCRHGNRVNGLWGNYLQCKCWYDKQLRVSRIYNFIIVDTLRQCCHLLQGSDKDYRSWAAICIHNNFTMWVVSTTGTNHVQSQIKVCGLSNTSPQQFIIYLFWSRDMLFACLNR